MPFLGDHPITAALAAAPPPSGLPAPSHSGPSSCSACCPLSGSSRAVAGRAQVPGRTGRSPGASFWLLFSSRSRRQLPGCSRPWPRSGGEVWVGSAGRVGTEPSWSHRDPAQGWTVQGRGSGFGTVICGAVSCFWASAPRSETDYGAASGTLGRGRAGRGQGSPSPCRSSSCAGRT